MKKKRLGVNIDHVATIRNARREIYPSPLKAALIAEKNGVDSITIHLREDRRHIQYKDLVIIKKKIKIPLNLEMSPTNDMLKIALKHRPKFVCIVPEKREEITTEGGLNLKEKSNVIKKIIHSLKKKSIRVSLFLEPKVSDILLAKKLDADCVEIHTGKYCNLFNKKMNTRLTYLSIKKAADLAKKLGLEVHAGHGLTYKSTIEIAKINSITEFNIGHFIISESVFVGLSASIKKFRNILRK